MAKITKKQALGRGLSAILNDPKNDIQSAEDQHADQIVGNIIELDLEFIEPNPFQPRSNFNEEQLQELATSIKSLGVIQPITVRKIGVKKYQLVSGERRFKASKLAGLKQIPAYVRLANDNESLEMALVENIQRQDLDPIEIALSYKRLIEEIDLTHEELSDRVGKNRSSITNYLRLLKLDPIIQTGMRDGFISMGHGRALINIEDQNKQIALYKKVIKDKLSVRETETLVKNNEFSKPKKNTKPDDSFYKTFIKEKKEALSFPVEVKLQGENKGKLQVSFNTQAQFKALIKLLEGEA